MNMINDTLLFVNHFFSFFLLFGKINLLFPINPVWHTDFGHKKRRSNGIVPITPLLRCFAASMPLVTTRQVDLVYCPMFNAL